MRCGRIHTHQSCMHLSLKLLASRNALLRFISSAFIYSAAGGKKKKTGWYLGGWAICRGVVENGNQKH